MRNISARAERDAVQRPRITAKCGSKPSRTLFSTACRQAVSGRNTTDVPVNCFGLSGMEPSIRKKRYEPSASLPMRKTVASGVHDGTDLPVPTTP